jgi:hypothetical protein
MHSTATSGASYNPPKIEALGQALDAAICRKPKGAPKHNGSGLKFPLPTTLPPSLILL